jgi:hypothetical protein
MWRLRWPPRVSTFPVLHSKSESGVDNASHAVLGINWGGYEGRCALPARRIQIEDFIQWTSSVQLVLAQTILADSAPGLAHAGENGRDRSLRCACGFPKNAARLAAVDTLRCGVCAAGLVTQRESGVALEFIWAAPSARVARAVS